MIKNGLGCVSELTLCGTLSGPMIAKRSRALESTTTYERWGTQLDEENIVLQMPAVIRDLWNAQQAVARYYADTGLLFTLDGRLVGDIAEALALKHFDLLLPQIRTKGVDALTKTGRTVQVKATGQKTSGPAFTPGDGRADYLLFFRFDFEANTASVAYNGPEAPVRKLLPETWEGTKVVALAEILQLANKVPRECALARLT